MFVQEQRAQPRRKPMARLGAYHSPRALPVHDIRLGGLFEDLQKAAQDAFTGGQKSVSSAVEKETAKALDQALSSVGAYQKIKAAGNAGATEAVTELMQKNAIPLFGLAVAGGVLGSAVFKGTTGLVGAGLVGAWGVMRLFESVAPPQKKEK